MQITKDSFEKTVLPNTIIEHLGVELLDCADGIIRAQMPVDHRTAQHYGVLCGGATLALAEIVAGLGSMHLCADNEIPRGIQVSANHIGAVPVGGKVVAEGRLIHCGRSTHVWNVDVTNDEGQLVSSIRVTNFILKKA